MRKLLVLGVAMILALGAATADVYARGGGGQGRGGSQFQTRGRYGMSGQPGMMQQQMLQQKAQYRHRYGQSGGGMGGMQQQRMGTCPYYVQPGTGGM